MSENNNKNTDKISKYDKLVIDIRGNLTTRLTDLMSKLLNSAQDNLFDMYESADNNENRVRYFELMNQIIKLKPDIACDFDINIKSLLIPGKASEQKQKSCKADNQVAELSLVGQDEMEGIVLVKSIGEHAASKYREQLQHLEARLEHLALKSEEIFTKNALIPTNFCQAFDDALSDDFDNIDKKILFGMFDDEIASKLDALYDSINNRLIDAGILPQIKLHAAKTPASRPYPKPYLVTDEAENTQQQDYADNQNVGDQAGNYTGGGHHNGNPNGAPSGNPSVGNIDGFAMTAAPGGSFRQSNSHSAPSKSNGGGNNNNANNTSASSADYQHYTAGMPAEQIGRILGNYINGTPITPSSTDNASPEHNDFYPASTAQHFGHQEIIKALSGIQGLPKFDQPQDTKIDGEAIKQAVLAEIAKISGGAVTKRINQIAEKTIYFIELIFDAIIEDEDISDTIKALLLRMQIPVIKASMADPEFFIYDEHPARVLLDTIADVGVGITDHDDEMYKHLEKTVSTIISKYDLTTEIFQNALDDLYKIIEQQEANAQAIEEEEQQQILRKHARATVLKALRAITTNKTLPETVHPLILKRWPTILFNHYLKSGKENDEWVNQILTLRKIVDSVQPITTAKQLAKLNADKDALFRVTEDYLNIVSNSKKDVQSIISAFKETIQSHCNDANFNEEEVIAAAESVTSTEPEEDQPVEEEAAKQEVPANVMPGMWFQVYMGEDQTARRCKLSVIIIEDAKLMFVNHKGELVTEKTFDEFNAEVANNITKMIMGHSAFDHAFKSVIKKLN